MKKIQDVFYKDLVLSGLKKIGLKLSYSVWIHCQTLRKCSRVGQKLIFSHCLSCVFHAEILIEKYEMNSLNAQRAGSIIVFKNST